MKRYCKYIILLIATALASCSQDNLVVDTERPDDDTDKPDTTSVADSTLLKHLQEHEQYSEYVSLLDDVTVNIPDNKEMKVSDMLASPEGAYTVFAPTNEAIQSYLSYLVEENYINEPSWEALDKGNILDSIRRAIVLNSILPYKIKTSEFPLNAGLYPANLNDHILEVTYDKYYPYIYIDGKLLSYEKVDICLVNGILHEINGVLAPIDNSAKAYIEKCLRNGTSQFSTMFRAIRACGLLDDLGKWRDMEYEKMYQYGRIQDLQSMTSYGFAEGNTAYAPEHRNIGYTIFAETDDFWRSRGIDPNAKDLCSQLTKWIEANGQYSDGYTTDGNYTSPKHLLYQWVTYHILPMRLTPDKLVYHINEYGFNLNNPTALGIPVFEYYTSFGKRRLIKLYESKESQGIYINRFPMLDNGRHGTGHEVGCDPDKQGVRIATDSPLAMTKDSCNACIYPIDAPISYTDDVRQNLGSERIRFDVMSLLPEAMTNDIRLNQSTAERSKYVYFPSEYNYFENLSFGRETTMVYFNAWNQDWCNLQRDEVGATGLYDVTIKLPPVPTKGEYELRYKVLGNPNRGMAQVFFGADKERMDAIGLPIDLTLNPSTTHGAAITGWADDIEDDEYNAAIDKQMRNNGYMKGAQSIVSYYGTERSYKNRQNIRRILLEQTLDPDKTYYVRFKSATDDARKQFYMDYFELCPKSIYHNRYQPEDIW